MLWPGGTEEEPADLGSVCDALIAYLLDPSWVLGCGADYDPTGAGLVVKVATLGGRATTDPEQGLVWTVDHGFVNGIWVFGTPKSLWSACEVLYDAGVPVEFRYRDHDHIPKHLIADGPPGGLPPDGPGASRAPATHADEAVQALEDAGLMLFAERFEPSDG